MRSFFIGILLACPAPASPGADESPAKAYRELLRQHNAASGAFRMARTDHQRKAAVDSLARFPKLFLDIATRSPKDPVAIPALRQAIQSVSTADSLAQVAWEMNHGSFPVRSEDSETDRIIAVLLRDHLESEGLAPICDRLRWSYRLENEALLSTILNKSPHRKIQAVACLALAQFLRDRLRTLELIDKRPERIQRYNLIFGRGYAQKLLRQGKKRMAQRVEALLEQATKYSTKLPSGRTVGEQAKMDLQELRHLSIGRMAPDSSGLDQDGRQFKLSDYRGKTVLLYFWLEF